MLALPFEAEADYNQLKRCKAWVRTLVNENLPGFEIHQCSILDSAPECNPDVCDPEVDDLLSPKCNPLVPDCDTIEDCTDQAAVGCTKVTGPGKPDALYDCPYSYHYAALEAFGRYLEQDHWYYDAPLDCVGDLWYDS